MKILLFTHIVDIDGMGSAVLSNIVFKNPDIIFCDTFEINQKVLQKLEDKSIYLYDKIFITDLCPNEDLIEKIENDENLKTKVQILDHHISILESLKSSHKIAKIIIENSAGKCSGTSLFYDYLKENSLILPNKVADDFVELTRQYDTWEWKTKYNNESANNLNIMFSIFGRENYVEIFSKKLANNESLFSENDKILINKFKENMNKICDGYIQKIHIETVANYTAAVIDEMEDEYKNDVAEKLKSKKDLNIDFVAMLITKRNTISFRAIKPDVNVGKIAELFGGKGHKPAGSCTSSLEAKTAFKIK